MISCCGRDPIWVENVPGKGYFFCEECRNEVIAPLQVEEVPLEWPQSDDQFSFMQTSLPASQGELLRKANSMLKSYYDDVLEQIELQEAFDRIYGQHKD